MRHPQIRKVDFGNENTNLEIMSRPPLHDFAKCLAPQPDLTPCKVAKAYGITRQAMHKMVGKHNLTECEFTTPALLYERLLKDGIDSPLRRKLSDPAERDLIQEEILTAYKNDFKRHIAKLYPDRKTASKHKGKKLSALPATV